MMDRKYRLHIIAVLIGFTFILLGQQWDFEEQVKYWDMFREGIKYGKMGDYELARILFNRYLAGNSENIYASIYHDIAGAALEHKVKDRTARIIFEGADNLRTVDYRKCILDFSLALIEDSTCAYLYLMRGLAFKENQYQAEALSDFSEAIELLPFSPYGYFFRGLIYRSLNNYEKAVGDFRRVLEIDSLSFTANVKLAESLNILGKYEESVQIFGSLTERDSTIKKSFPYYEAFHNLGAQNLRKGKYLRAVECFTESIQCQPHIAIGYLNRSIAFRNLELYDEALVDLDSTVARDPENGDAYLNRGIVFFELNQPGQALRDLLKSLALSPDNVRAYYYMGEVYFREKEYEVAALNYSRAISSDPDFYWSYYKKAMVCDLLDLKDEAIHNFVLFLEKSTDKNFKQNAYARQRIKTLKKY